MDNRLTHIIVADAGYWGKGTTLSEAMANYKQESGYNASKKAVVYAVTPETRINEMGNLAMPRALFVEPVVIQRKGTHK